MRKVLFISMLGEDEHVPPERFRSLAASGLEKDWVTQWHGGTAQNAGLALTAIDICRGDRFPAADMPSGVVLGGTMHVVTEDRPWLRDLAGWLKAYRQTGRPLLAICGGHQLLSTVFDDGTLTGRENGTLAGTHEATLTPAGRAHPLFRGLSERPRFHFANYLHVLPARKQQAGILAIQPDSPAIAIDHGRKWYSCQFHPESRKSSWDAYYSHVEADYRSAYSDAHDGDALMENFFGICASSPAR